MTRPPSRSSRLTHLPALDGLRGVAVIAVLCFHGGFSWAKGGFLGVSMFFTLSGFLITSLLLREWGTDRHIDLRAFWSRRFRRLMPAALATLVGVCVLAWWLGTHAELHSLRLDVWAAVAYVANWRFIFAGRSYADLFSAPSPVQHFWSLAVEEQFYFVYPLIAFGALRARRPSHARRGAHGGHGGVAALGVASSRRPRPRVLRDRYARRRAPGRRPARPVVDGAAELAGAAGDAACGAWRSVPSG